MPITLLESPRAFGQFLERKPTTVLESPLERGAVDVFPL
jgi:hypothetical protein